jgi:hypothetical protein
MPLKVFHKIGRKGVLPNAFMSQKGCHQENNGAGEDAAGKEPL